MTDILLAGFFLGLMRIDEDWWGVVNIWAILWVGDLVPLLMRITPNETLLRVTVDLLNLFFCTLIVNYYLGTILTISQPLWIALLKKRKKKGHRLTILIPTFWTNLLWYLSNLVILKIRMYCNNGRLTPCFVFWMFSQSTIKQLWCQQLRLTGGAYWNQVFGQFVCTLDIVAIINHTLSCMQILEYSNIF